MIDSKLMETLGAPAEAQELDSTLESMGMSRQIFEAAMDAANRVLQEYGVAAMVQNLEVASIPHQFLDAKLGPPERQVGCKLITVCKGNVCRTYKVCNMESIPTFA